MTALSVAEAVERVYTAFAPDRLPPIIHHSPIESREDFDAIYTRPLRELAAPDLSYFAFCAMFTIGNTLAYRHFLPRILELAVVGSWESGLGPEVIAGKLVYGEWRSWPVNRQEAVTDLFEAAAQLALTEGIPDDDRIGSWLTGLALLELPLDAFLAAWRASRSIGATVQLATFASYWAGDRREKVPSYWKDVAPQHRAKVRDWLISRATISQLVDALGVIAEEDRWRLAGAIDRVRFRLN